MRIHNTLAAAWVGPLAWALIACGSHTQSQGPSSGAGPVIDVTIAHGQVSPTNADLHARVHQQITLKVNSDASDELHVHSTPDHKFPVAAAPDQTFQFSVDVPGNVEVELHHLDRTIATVQVQQ